MDDAIRFYAAREDFGGFSNFSPHPIVLKGKTWPTSEHYFQARKFVGTPDEDEAVRCARSPRIAAHMGRDRERPWTDPHAGAPGTPPDRVELS